MLINFGTKTCAVPNMVHWSGRDNVVAGNGEAVGSNRSTYVFHLNVQDSGCTPGNSGCMHREGTREQVHVLGETAPDGVKFRKTEIIHFKLKDVDY